MKVHRKPSLFHAAKQLGFILLLGFFSSVCLGQGVSIRSSFEPSSITLSNQCVYKVVIQGSHRSPQLNIPRIDGLLMSSAPQTLQSTSIINGHTSITLELRFSVNPQREGAYTLPAWFLTMENKKYKVPAASLEVLSPSQRDILKLREQKKQQDELKNAVLIDFSLPRDYLYHGETVLSEISLFLWNRMMIRPETPPSKIGDAFSITNPGNPTVRENVQKFNKSYTTYSWTVGLTAAMEGNHSLAYHSNVLIRTNERRSSPFNSPFFNDPFFNDPFFGLGRETSVQVTSRTRPIEIRTLPSRGKPPNFTGAIGNFEISSSIDSKSVAVGDPVRLTITISGKGNFAAMPAPQLQAQSTFKVGPPAFSFAGNQENEFSGVQRFEYVITPLQSGKLEIVSPSFAYFDPATETYHQADHQIHLLQVDPDENWNESDEVFAKEVEKQKTNPVYVVTSQTETEPGEWHANLIAPLISKSMFFWCLQIFPFSVFILLLILGFRKRNRGLSSLKQKEIKLLRDLRRSCAFHDNRRFFRSFRSIIQFKIGMLENHPNPFTLSSEEIIKLLNGRTNDAHLILELESILKRIDSLEFAGNETSNIKLKHEYKEAKLFLKKLK